MLSRIQKRNRHRRDQLYLHDGNIKKDRYGKDFKNCHASSISGKLAVDFLSGLDEVLCLEELDPVIERELIYICGNIIFQPELTENSVVILPVRRKHP